MKWDNPRAEKGKHTKFQHLWIGPYLVTEKLGPATYKLQDLQGLKESLPINGLCLKHYFTQSPRNPLYINKLVVIDRIFQLFIFLFVSPYFITLVCLLLINQLNFWCLEV